MKITEYSSTSKTSAVNKKKAASASGGADGFFGLLSTDEPDSITSSPSLSATSPVGTLDGLLSLQEMPDDEIKKRKAVQNSQFTLEALETLRNALLTGSVPEQLIKTMHRVVSAQKQQIDDPRLMSIIEDIELRAAVELAKLERATNNSF